MILRSLILLLIAVSCLAPPVPAQTDTVHPLSSLSPPFLPRTQDLSKTVLPVTSFKLHGPGIEESFGTGFCLDPACRFIATTYHAALLGQPRKIKGEKVIRQYLATGPNDEGATSNGMSTLGAQKYTLSRDLAIFELRHPLRHYRGIAYTLDGLQLGQDVDIYAYPKETISPFRKLMRFHGTFKGTTPTDLLAFDYTSPSAKEIRPGASGGIVVDSKTQRIVGILSGIGANGPGIALAVPVESLADFVSKVQPWLAHSLFPNDQDISPVAADLYPKYLPPPSTDALQHRTDEPPEIKVLRSRAQLLADSVRNFIAVQTFAWGSGDHEPAAVAAYEVRVLDGYQRFREYPDGKKELKDVPFPPLDPVMVPGGEWSELPKMVGTELGLKIHQAPDAVVKGRPVKVFQYWAAPEDGVCKWKSVSDFVFFAVNKIYTVACYGEVWTDQDSNIVRISEHYELPGKWKNFRGVVTYGWLRQRDEPPRLIPQTITTQAEFKKKVYWCRGQFADYRVFTSRARIVAK